MDPHRTPNRHASFRKHTWQLFTFLLLLIFIASPVIAAPVQDDLIPTDGPDGVEQENGFIEFGPPNLDAADTAAPAAAPQKSMLRAAPALMQLQAAPGADLPAYDEEALARFDVQNVLESDRHLAIDIGPRVTGTKQEQEAAEYFGAKLASYGYEVSYQHWAAGSTKNVASVTSPNRDLQGGPDQTLGGPNWQMGASPSAKFTGDEAAVVGDVIYAGTGLSESDFPLDTAGKIVMMDYGSTAAARNTSVVNAVAHGAAAVILAQTRSNSAPSSFTLTTPQPDIPVVGGGEAHRIWIKDLLAEGPLTLRIATFSYPNPQGTNVIGVRHAVNDPTGASAPVIMVGGHIDSVLGAPGAHDNATGPSTAVEAGRVLAQYALDKEVRVVGYGGEEIGMYGSKAYVASLSPEERARFVGAWDMDMEGTPYAPAGFWALTPNGQSNFVVQSAYASAARFGFAGLANCKLGQSDHQSFYDAGIPASLFIWLDYRPNVNGCGSNGSYATEPVYHRPTDTMSNVSPERLEISLKVVGGAALYSALNGVTLQTAGGSPVGGAAIEADCGDGQRYFGATGSDGSLVAAIPHATCDFTATKGSTVSKLEDVAVTGDASLTFPAFRLPEPVVLHGSADPARGALGEDWSSCDALDTNSVGAKTVACSDAEGRSSAVSYNVVYQFDGFFTPVDAFPAFNTANSGQVVPLKWRITDAFGAPVTDLPGVNLNAASVPCSLGNTGDQLEEYSSGKSGLLNQGDGNYQFNWNTPKSYANSCKTVMLDLGEGPGMERTASFQFTR